MGFLDAVKAQFRPSADSGVAQHAAPEDAAAPATVTGDFEKSAATEPTDVDTEAGEKVIYQVQPEQQGVARVEAIQAVWGKKGRYILIAGIGMMMMMYEMDNSTVWTYQNYAISDFNSISMLASLSTAGTIIFAVIKPPIAKLSDIIGRGETYIFTISCYVLSYICCSTATSINGYAAGYILHNIAQSGTNIMNDIMISDISSARWRGLAIGISFFPFLFTPWICAFIIDSVVGGIGWRWGIGMFAFLMPFASSFIIYTLLHYQGKAKKMGIITKRRMNLYDFCSLIDLGGNILLAGGLSMVLLPLTLAGTSPSSWSTPWIIALIVLGVLFLIALPFYESLVAVHPVVPVHYFKNPTIVISFILIAFDSVGFACTHTYIYTWVVISHDYSPRDATFYLYTNGVMQCLTGIIAGFIMLKTHRYKWLLMTGAVVRLVGYGVMIRFRGADNSTAELFIIQLVQGLGSGIVQTTVLVAAQIVVPHAQMAQITALVLCSSFLGSSVGSSIAGGIYTNTFIPALWSQLGPDASETLVQGLFDSITGVIPEWGSASRIAINLAYSDVVRYMTYAALGACIPALGLVWFMPDLELPETVSTVEEEETF